MGEYVRNAKHVIEFYLDLLTEHYSDSRTLRMKVEAEVIPYIIQLKSPIDQSHFVKQIADRIRIPEEAVMEAVKKQSIALRQGESKETFTERGVKLNTVFQRDEPERARLNTIKKHIHSI